MDPNPYFRYTHCVSRAFPRARYKFDHTLAILTFVLAVFGLVMISSVSVYESTQAYTQMGVQCDLIESHCNGFYLWRQARNILIALPFWFAAASIPYLLWRRLALAFFIGSIAMLIALFIPGLSTGWGTSQSWLNIPILNSIQPIELTKLGLIFYLARWMEVRREDIATLESGFLPFSVILGAIVFLLVLQPDFGGVLVVTMIATAIYYAAGARVKHIAIGATIVGFLAVLAVNFSGLDYIRNRFTAFLDPTVDPEGIGYQIKQSLIAVGKGGFFGEGITSGTQKSGYLPEAQSDSIFAATAEEIGFFGSVIFTFLFLLIAYRGFKIASACPDRFGQLTAVGISTALLGQAFVNIGVNIGILPYTGITLPFISYGGSSLVASFISAGILLNISKYSNVHSSEYYRENNPYRRRIGSQFANS